MLTPETLQKLRDHVAKNGISTDDLMRMLSDDAKACAGSCFGNMRPGEGHMTFHMIESRPSPRMQSALDELVAAGLLKAEPFNKYGGVKYTVQANLNDYWKWMLSNIDREDIRFPISEPIA